VGRAGLHKAWIDGGDGPFRALLCVPVLCALLWGCGPRNVAPREVPPVDLSHTQRPLHENELTELCVERAGLELPKCWEILARLNTKDVRYIKEDLKRGNILKVPNNFKAHSNFSPLPARLPLEPNPDKFILIVKNIPFLGWYEKGVWSAIRTYASGKSQAGRGQENSRSWPRTSIMYPRVIGAPTATRP